MGSFYATCSLSNMSIIDGEKMYIQFLVPTWKDHKVDVYINKSNGDKIVAFEKGLRVSNDGSIAQFSPFGFAIKGKYDDYGNMLPDDDNDPNIKMLEEYFNLKFDDIMGCATDTRWYEYSYKPLVIEKKTSEEEIRRAASWTIGNNEMKNVEVLGKLTVTYFNNKAYEYLSNKLRLDDTWWKDEIEKRYVNLYDTLKEMAKVKDMNSGKKIQFGDITDEHIAEYKAIFSKEFIENKTDDDLKMDYFLMMNTASWFSSFDRKFYLPSILKTNQFIELSINETHLEDVLHQRNLLVNLSGMNRVLEPSQYGGQEPNFGLIYGFMRHMSKEIGNKHNEWKKECEE